MLVSSRPGGRGTNGLPTLPPRLSPARRALIWLLAANWGDWKGIPPTRAQCVVMPPTVRPGCCQRRLSKRHSTFRCYSLALQAPLASQAVWWRSIWPETIRLACVGPWRAAGGLGVIGGLSFVAAPSPGLQCPTEQGCSSCLRFMFVTSTHRGFPHHCAQLLLTSHPLYCTVAPGARPPAACGKRQTPLAARVVSKPSNHPARLLSPIACAARTGWRSCGWS